MTRDISGPAFPSHARARGADGEVHSEYELHSAGITLRDYFAAKAMQALALDTVGDELLAERAYAIADAMLLERVQPASTRRTE